MIKDFKDLEKLFKLCRKQGISNMSIGDMSFTLGDIPESIKENQTNHSIEDSNKNPYSGFPEDRILTNDELSFWSSGGMPEESEE